MVAPWVYNAPSVEPIGHGTRAPRYVLVTGFAFREGTRHSATRNTEHETEDVVAAAMAASWTVSDGAGWASVRQYGRLLQSAHAYAAHSLLHHHVARRWPGSSPAPTRALTLPASAPAAPAACRGFFDPHVA